MKTRRFALVLAALLGLAAVAPALADVCTYGADNFRIKAQWPGGSSDEKSACMFSCTTRGVTFHHSDCFKSSSSGSTWHYTCDVFVSGEDRRPKDLTWWGFSQHFNKVVLPANQNPDPVMAAAGLSCHD